MRLVGRLIVTLLFAAAVLTAVSFLLPREITVTRETRIDAAPAAIFPLVNSLQRTAEWSPWADLDPEMTVTYSGPDAGVGNRMTWSSENERVGSGSQEIMISEPDERVETAVDFGGMGSATSWIVLAPDGDATKVTWGLLTDAGHSPVARWMGLMMDRWVGADYEKGLERLKTLAEAG